MDIFSLRSAESRSPGYPRPPLDKQRVLVHYFNLKMEDDKLVQYKLSTPYDFFAGGPVNLAIEAMIEFVKEEDLDPQDMDLIHHLFFGDLANMALEPVVELVEP
jgi:hypothetical protein